MLRMRMRERAKVRIAYSVTGGGCKLVVVQRRTHNEGHHQRQYGEENVEQCHIAIGDGKYRLLRLKVSLYFKVHSLV